MRIANLLAPVTATLVLAGACLAQDPAREAARAAGLYAPSVWDLKLGLHASQLPREEFINYACGTNGGPPSVQLGGWTDWARCPPEPDRGLHEIAFEYDDEPEYVARARSLDAQAALFAGTTAYGREVIISALFDAAGVLNGIRIVTDPRAPVARRELGSTLSGYLAVRFGDQDWTCLNLARRAGETDYRGAYIRRQCRKTGVAAGLERTADADAADLTLETYSYRKPGQSAVDPVTRRATEGQFESSTRFEAMLAAEAIARAGRAPLPAPIGPSERERLAAKARDCPGCDLAGANLKRADLRDANLAGAKLAGANLHGALLGGANLAGADLGRANLNRADLRRARLADAVLADAMLYEARADGADLSRADLAGALAGRVQLIGASLRAARATEADLRDARLGNADLGLADLSGSWLMNAQLARARLGGARLVGTVAWKANLAGADLSHSNARNADFHGAVLRGADLSVADFSGARLTQANLAEARLDGTLFAGAELPPGFEVR